MKRHPGVPGARRFWSFDFQIYDNRVLSISNHHCFANLARAGVYFLMRHIRWHINEITWMSFIALLQVVPPSHSYTAPYNIKHGL